MQQQPVVSSNYQQQEPLVNSELFPAQNLQQNEHFGQPGLTQFNQVHTQIHSSPYASFQESMTPVAHSGSVGQYTASPGMQYMNMPFQDEMQSAEPGLSYQDQTMSTSKPTQVVPPQPQTSQPPQSPFYTPAGQLAYTSTFLYQPVQPHWFYQKKDKSWLPFSFIDSRNLEAAYGSKEKTVVATDGGRYDVDLDLMKREAVYWKEKKTDVRRCTWFYRGEGELKLVPYEENVAEILEVCE